MKIAIAIETRDRRLNGGRNFLRETLRNMRRAGVFQSPHLTNVFLVHGGGDPMEGVFPPDELCIVPDRGRTRQQNGMMAIACAALDKEADFVLKIEDDLDFCKDFLGSVARWLGDYGQESVRMFSFGSTFETIENSRYEMEAESVMGRGRSFPTVRGLLKAKRHFTRTRFSRDGGFWGAQAVAFRRHQALDLVQHMGPNPQYLGQVGRHHDLLIGEWAEDIGYAIPSFVQHIGNSSNLGNKYFQFPFPGQWWSYE